MPVQDPESRSELRFEDIDSIEDIQEWMDVQREEVDILFVICQTVGVSYAPDKIKWSDLDCGKKGRALYEIQMRLDHRIHWRKKKMQMKEKRDQRESLFLDLDKAIKEAEDNEKKKLREEKERHRDTLFSPIDTTVLTQLSKSEQLYRDAMFAKIRKL